MNRNAFTTVELIFVIVIIGILAAVAIPKLMATRDDAKISRMSTYIREASNEIIQNSTSKIGSSKDLTTMSNIIKSLKERGEVTTEDYKANFLDERQDVCLTIEIRQSANGEELHLIPNDNNNNRVCVKVKEIMNFDKYPINLRGQMIVY